MKMIGRCVGIFAVLLSVGIPVYAEESWTLVNNEPGLLVYQATDEMPESGTGAVSLMGAGVGSIGQLPQFQMARIPSRYSAVFGFYVVPDAGRYPLVGVRRADSGPTRISLSDRLKGGSGTDLSVFAFSISSEIIPVLLDGRFGEWSQDSDVARFGKQFRPDRVLKTEAGESTEISASESRFESEPGCRIRSLRARMTDTGWHFHADFEAEPNSGNRLLFYAYSERDNPSPDATLEVFPGLEAAPVLFFAPGLEEPTVVGYSVSAGRGVEVTVHPRKLPMSISDPDVGDLSIDIATAWVGTSTSEQYFFSTVFLRDLRQ